MAIELSLSKRALEAFGPGAKAHDAKVLDSSIHWVEAGQGKPIVFIHGNPTSAFLWRKVFSRLSGQGRLLAVDLIGFGESGKPAIATSETCRSRPLGAGNHYVPEDQPEAIAQAIEAWLKAIER